MSAHSTAASRSTFASIRSASRCITSARPGGAERGPGGERVGRRRQRELCLPLAAPRDLGERLAVDRAQVGERRVATDPLAADEVLGRDLDPGDRRRAHAEALPKATVATSTGVWPPSTGRIAPLTYEASSETSQATVAATSSALAARRSGTSAVQAS